MLFLQIMKFMWFLLASLLLEEDGDGEGEGESDGDDDDNDDDDGDDTDDADDDDTDDTNLDDPKAKIAALEQKSDRHVKKRKEAEQALKKAQDRLKELENAGKPEDEKQAERLAELERSTEDQNRQIASLSAVNALLVHPDIAKLPPDRRRLAIKMLEEKVEFDEDGNNVDEIVGELKSNDPIIFSLKDDSSDDGDDTQNGSKSRPSGKPVGGKKRKDKNSLDDAALKKRFPAISR